MDLKKNALELSANICSAWKNTEGISTTTFVAEKPSEIRNEVEIELEVESNKKESTSKLVTEEVVSRKCTDKIHINESQAVDVAICSVSVKTDAIKMASSTVDLETEANKKETFNTTGDESLLSTKNSSTTNNDGDLVKTIMADSSTANNPEVVTDVTIDDDGKLAKKNNYCKEIIDVVEYNFATKYNRNPVKCEPLERKKLGKRKQGDSEIIPVSSGSDIDHPATSKCRKIKQARTDPAEEKKRLIQLICSYPVLYDPNNSDVKTIGSKKAAYQEIANKMGLTRKFSFER